MSIKINSFLINLKNGDLKNSLRQILPTRYQSQHNFDSFKEKKGNYLFLFMLVVGLISLYFCKVLWKLINEKRIKLNRNYRLLVYVPNNKYHRFYNNIFNDISDKEILVISDVNIDLNHITKNSFFDSRSSYIWKVVLPSFMFAINSCYGEIIKKKKKEVDFSIILHLLSSVTQSFFLKYLSNNTCWSKIFSLHPNGDLHFLLALFFDTEIHSIRPDTTVESKEHNHIKSDYLYYKSNFEREVYLKSNLDMKLVKAGFLYDKIAKPKKKFEKELKILFVDTCTSKDQSSVAIRERAIHDYYKVFSGGKKQVKLYHKFHPGLLKSEKKRTVGFLENKSVSVVHKILNMAEYDVVIGFFSTLHHDVLCSGVCYIEVTGEYNIVAGIESPNHLSPLPKINNFIDFKNTLIQIQDNIEDLYDPKIWNWYLKNNLLS
jgi:hypothetical protein